ncbi:hypothetical protein CDAR_560401 [Caerostris darwini]|uniref:Uncharacterized protein n=1 Tax=Caerostris darwini TaxID=1538125 RepID=A0AAV4W1X5_9ARAC|nr:hypothetical protein CDAR_560141 [Caerostris darwini]GIY75678.1 hypothetical protein CDAR_560401 [Caerostris darwini]
MKGRILESLLPKRFFIPRILSSIRRRRKKIISFQRKKNTQFFFWAEKEKAMDNGLARKKKDNSRDEWRSKLLFPSTPNAIRVPLEGVVIQKLGLQTKTFITC